MQYGSLSFISSIISYTNQWLVYLLYDSMVRWYCYDGIDIPKKDKCITLLLVLPNLCTAG